MEFGRIKQDEIYRILETRDYLPLPADAPDEISERYRKSLRPYTRRDFAEVLVTLCESAAYSADASTTLSNIMRTLQHIFRSDDANFLLFTSDGSSLSRWTLEGADSECEYGANAAAAVWRICNTTEGGRSCVLDLTHAEDKKALIRPNTIEEGFKDALIIPLKSSDVSLGICVLSYKRTIDLIESDLGLADLLGKTAGTLVQRVKATYDSSELAVLEERQRLSAEIHDNVSHGIGALSVSAGSIIASFDEGDMDAVRSGMARFEALCGRVMHQFRDEMLSLRVPLDRTEELIPGIESCLQNFESQWGIRTEFILEAIDQPPSVNLAVSLQLMRILNECLSNVARHAHATNVVVVFEENQKEIIMQVEDDGCGFVLTEVPMERMGLRIMASRARDVGGELIVSSCPAGTTVTARIPRLGQM